MTNNLTNVQRRAVQYWFVDGLAEIAAGLFFLLLALIFALWESIFTTLWGFLAVMVVGLLISFGLRLTTQRIKERSTYPRTGYAAPLTGLENKTVFAFAVGFALLMLVLNLFANLHGPEDWNWSTAFAGLVAGYVLGLAGYLTRLRRFVFLALFSVLAGVALAFLPLPGLLGGGILIGMVGLVVLLLGLRTRRAYLRENPAPEL